jgi:hypothetical protein
MIKNDAERIFIVVSDLPKQFLNIVRWLQQFYGF